MKYLNPMTQLNRKIYMIQTHSWRYFHIEKQVSQL
jgi:hypothetical protein